MAHLVYAGGLSHSPLLAAPSVHWLARGNEDRNNSSLYDETGRLVTFVELETRMNGSVAAHTAPEVLEHRWSLCQRSLDRLRDDLAAVKPDVVIVVGDDQRELYESSNSPALALYLGSTLKMATARENAPTGAFWEQVWQAYGMDQNHEFPGAPDEALHLSRTLMAAGFDLAVSDAPTGRGFGHAFGFPIVRLGGREQAWRTLPVMLNTYYPPNQPTPARCFELGVAIRRGIEEMPADVRVALLASGGLSHFVVNERLDQALLDALRTGDRDHLTSIPLELLNAGSSEIRNWVTLGGAIGGMASAWIEYVPCYRSAAGTGCGMAFAAWLPSSGDDLVAAEANEGMSR